MARLRFPQDRTAFVYQGDYAAVLTPPRTGLQVYADAACTQLADIVDPVSEGAITGSTVYTENGLVDEFLGPDGVTRLWIRIVGSTGAGKAVDPTAASLLLDGGQQAISFTHTQSSPLATWSVPHLLGRRPSSVSLFSLDFGEQYDEFTIHHVDVDNLLISIDVPSTGVALIGI